MLIDMHVLSRTQAMNITWVLGMPMGDEEGQYLTVDLGGTNLRTCLVTLQGRRGETTVDQELTELPNDVKTGTGEQLWRMVAEAIESFIAKRGLQRTGDQKYVYLIRLMSPPFADHSRGRIPMGFTFSYPAMQDRIDHGTLTTWTKGFDIQGVEGQDVVAQLGEAMEKRVSGGATSINRYTDIPSQELPVKIVAMVNDTTGALVASAYSDPDTIIGAIFGTGCNAAYLENMDCIPKLKSDLPPHTPVVINCEYGAFDNAHRVLPRTRYDKAIDDESPKPGEQAFEKMSAGLYLGEIYRQIMCDLHDRGLVFRDRDVSGLRKPYNLDTAFLSSMENDPDEEKGTFFARALGFRPTEEEMLLSQRLAEIIAARGARLCACGVAAICRMKGIESGHVAADGSVANKHPAFKSRWTHALGEILDWPQDRKGPGPITITSAEDGSGVGAAVIAAMTIKRRNEGRTTGMRQ